MRPNWQWGADTAYHRGVLSWNPVYRTFSPNRRGETTWWNPRIAQGWTPYTDPQIFQEFARNFKREPREGEESTNTSGRRLTTLQIIELMKNTIPGKGKRNENLFRYVQHFQALKARELGCHPTLEDHRRIAFDGNSLYSQPHPYIQVEQIAKWFFNHPVYKKQQNTARKRRPKSQLKVSQVFECLDALTVLQLIWKVKPTVSDGGIFCRYGQPIIHPMYEKYKNTLWFSKPGTPRHLAEVDGRWSVKTINQYLRLYKDVYENHPKAHEVKEVWDGGVERV